jgi:putative NADH-flavin reductase
MRVTVFGATGGIGRHAVEQALAAGHAVVAFTRDASRLGELAGRVEIVTGDARDSAAVATAIQGADAVIDALGPTTNDASVVDESEVQITGILAGMRAHGVTRLVALNGAGCDMPGERKPIAGRLASAFVRLAARHVVAAKQRELDLLVASEGVDWTAVRPPRVTEGAGGAGYLLGDRLTSRAIAQGDLARAMVDLAATRDHVRGAPYVSAED